MKRNLFFFGLMAFAVLVSCYRETETPVVPSPGFDPESGTVKTQFVLNVSTATGKDTKTTAEFVQKDNPFLGMEAVHLVSYSLDAPAEGGAFFKSPYKADGTVIAADRDYNLGDLFPAGAVTASSSSRTLELALPLGTNVVMLYGKAKKTVSDDLQGAVSLEGSVTDLSSIKFSLVSRLSSQGAFDAGTFFFSTFFTYLTVAGLVNENTFWDHSTGTEDRSYGFWWPQPDETVAEQLADEVPAPTDGISAVVEGETYSYHAGELSWKQLGTMYKYAYDTSDATNPNSVVTTKNGTPMSLAPLAEVLGYAYNELTTIQSSGTLKELRAGSASAVIRVLQDLHAVVERVADGGPTGWEEVAAKLLAQQILERMDTFMAMDNGNGLNFLKNSDGTYDISTLVTNISNACSSDTWNANKSNIETYFDGSYFMNGTQEDGFPVNVGLPKGASIMTCDVQTAQNKVDQFRYITDIPAYGMGDATFPIANYRYPPELMYFGNSPLRVSSVEKKENDYPASVSNWNNEGQWAGWENNAAVKSDTRSVAMVNNVNYGTALLASTVKFRNGSLKDNNSVLHPGEEDNVISTSYSEADKGIFVTGVIVGGVADVVDWSYTRRPKTVTPSEYGYDEATGKFTGVDYTGNAFDKMIFDKVTTTYKVGATTEPIYTMVWDNYDATKPADEQSDVYVGLELVNKTDEDFWGEMNLIRKGGTFYLLGKLDLASAVNKAREDNGSAFTDLSREYYCYPPFNPSTGETVNAPRVFMQDYITTADLMLGEDALKHAYVTVPDLRSSQISLGLSIDMTWTPGLAFEVEMGGVSN